MQGLQGLGTIDTVDFNDPLFSVCDAPFYATALNDLGQIVGYTDVYPDEFQLGFSWRATAFNVFGGSWPPTFVSGISNASQIVGQNSSIEAGTVGFGHATSWKNGVADDLGSLGGGASVTDFSSFASGVNDSGSVVGWSTTTPISFLQCSIAITDCPIHAVLWSGSGAIQDLGTLPGDTFSAALKINLFGIAIGSSGNTLSDGSPAAVAGSAGFPEVIGHPFIWSQGSGMQDLNALIPSNSGWVLNSATDINLWGQIVGEGTFNGQVRGFLLTPTNPFQLH